MVLAVGVSGPAIGIKDGLGSGMGVRDFLQLNKENDAKDSAATRAVIETILLPAICTHFIPVSSSQPQSNSGSLHSTGFIGSFM